MLIGGLLILINWVSRCMVRAIPRLVAANWEQPAASTLLPSGPQQAEDQCSPDELLAEQGGYLVPDKWTTVEENGHDSATVGFPQVYEGQAVAMEDSGKAELVLYRPNWEFFPLNVISSRMPGEKLYFTIWNRSSSGDTPNVLAVIWQFVACRSPLQELVTVIDAVCTHVPITLGRASLNDVIEWLRRGLKMCEGIVHSSAKVLIVRLERRIACIYFRKGMHDEARQKINEVKRMIHGMLTEDYVDVGTADAYWLLAWIKLFEVWGNESQLEADWPDINDNASRALNIALRIPDEELRMACSGRIACCVACLKMVVATRSSFQHERPDLVREASDLVNSTAECELTKGDRSLWCRAKVLLIFVRGGPLEQIPNDLIKIISECRDVDTSNDIFTQLSEYKEAIENIFR